MDDMQFEGVSRVDASGVSAATRYIPTGDGGGEWVHVLSLFCNGCDECGFWIAVASGARINRQIVFLQVYWYDITNSAVYQ
jgi:hypothetical protein